MPDLATVERRYKILRICLTLSIIVFASTVAYAASMNSFDSYKPTVYSVNIHQGQVQLNQVYLLWQTNSIGLNMTNMKGGVFTDQAQLVFYNGTDTGGTQTSPLGTEVYTFLFTPSNETAIAYVGGWPFTLNRLIPGSQILVQV